MTTPDDKRPREWDFPIEVVNGEPTYTPQTGATGAPVEIKYVRVIEKSSYDALLAEAEALAAALSNSWDEIDNQIICHCGYFGDDTEETGMSTCAKCDLPEAPKRWRKFREGGK